MKIDAAGEMFSLSARHLSEWRGPHPDLVGGFERDSAPIQKLAEHIEPADHKHDLARDRLTYLSRSSRTVSSRNVPLFDNSSVALHTRTYSGLIRDTGPSVA